MDAVEDILEGREAGAVSPARARRRTKNEPKAGLRVLLAEDNAVNQRVATAMLRRRGHEVDVVDNGLAAVEAVRERPYDVVLMDVQMPELDGLEAARRIRGEGFTDLRIVALTAHATTDDRDRCLDAGMNGFLTKPFESRDLFGAVEADSPGPRRRASSVPERTRNPVDLAAFTATMREAGVGEIVGDTLRAYLAEGPDRIRALQDGMASGDSEAVRKAAHALKSSSSAIGARRLADVLEETERESRLGSADRLRGLIGEVLGEYRAVVEQLEHSLAVRA
jgi:CheY-like chemotaxis protein